MKTREIIECINGNGGIDQNHIMSSARQDGVSTFEYLRDYVKSNYDCHGNTANAVARYFI